MFFSGPWGKPFQEVGQCPFPKRARGDSTSLGLRAPPETRVCSPTCTHVSTPTAAGGARAGRGQHRPGLRLPGAAPREEGVLQSRRRWRQLEVQPPRWEAGAAGAGKGALGAGARQGLLGPGAARRGSATGRANAPGARRRSAPAGPRPARGAGAARSPAPAPPAPPAPPGRPSAAAPRQPAHPERARRRRDGPRAARARPPARGHSQPALAGPTRPAGGRSAASASASAGASPGPQPAGGGAGGGGH
jgi:hypothetical protein